MMFWFFPGGRNNLGLPKTYNLVKTRRRQWHPTPVLLPGKFHGWRSLVGCSPWGGKESDTTEQLHFHFSLSCIGGGNGNLLQCSSLENPRDGGAWWAAVYGVAQSQTWLTRQQQQQTHGDPWGVFHLQSPRGCCVLPLPLRCTFRRHPFTPYECVPLDFFFWSNDNTCLVPSLMNKTESLAHAHACIRVMILPFAEKYPLTV